MATTASPTSYIRFVPGKRQRAAGGGAGFESAPSTGAGRWTRLAGRCICPARAQLLSGHAGAERRTALRDSRRALSQGGGRHASAGAATTQDLARSYCLQTELAVSRLAQDAEARCAQWLLHHATEHAEGGLRVILNARKRLIAAQLGIAPETFARAAAAA